eukprot:CAMPEP_0197560658 /NCGR_PEP_ID=MMETSP1320-20131121/23619_1 /TAXON_ID=91990 /ORGANISM="Bolidomonas sp., Strain RCC2347" /LENGTH=31 /DNA_ID= /DNA_START= /DNA_END= /DNA_ORIENTATION=
MSTLAFPPPTALSTSVHSSPLGSPKTALRGR